MPPLSHTGARGQYRRLMNDLPSRHAPETSRRLGLLLAVAVLTMASRWLHPVDADAPVEDAPLQAAPPPHVETPVQIAQITQVEAQPRQSVRVGATPDRGTERAAATVSAARPVSAALCHALDERMKALDSHAAGKLPRHELRKLRAERQRARELQQGLRCRAGGDRYWF
jgi:hypothetical protein